MRAFISQLIMPLPLFWLTLLAGATLFYFRKKKAGRSLIIIAVGWMAIISTNPVPNLFVRSLEKRYEPLLKVEIAPDSMPVHIMVLGGGHTSNRRLPPTNQLAQLSLGRLVEGIRIHRAIPGSKLILSGWGGYDANSQAEMMAAAAVSMGVDSADIYELSKPHNTRTEAGEYYAAFGDGHPLIVVTDATHMPRAIMHFRRLGLSPLAAPTNHILKSTYRPGRIDLWPSASNIDKSQRVIHEYVGMIWANLTD